VLGASVNAHIYHQHGENLGYLSPSILSALREAGTHGPDVVVDRWPGAARGLPLTGIAGE
jgi:hypothetical protein